MSSTLPRRKGQSYYATSGIGFRPISKSKHLPMHVTSLGLVKALRPLDNKIK